MVATFFVWLCLRFPIALLFLSGDRRKAKPPSSSSSSDDRVCSKWRSFGRLVVESGDMGVFTSTIFRRMCSCRSCERLEEVDKNFFTRIGGGGDAPANVRFGNVNFGSRASPVPRSMHFFETTSTHIVAKESLSFASLVAAAVVVALVVASVVVALYSLVVVIVKGSNIALAATSTTSSWSSSHGGSAPEHSRFVVRQS